MNPLFVRLGLRSQEFTAGMIKARNDLADINKSTAILSKSLESLKSVAVSAFSVWGIKKAITEVITLADEQEKAEKKLASVIRSTGSAAGYTLDQMKKYAEQLQKVTTYGDEVIINAQAIVSTFTSIKGEQFDRTVKSVLNLTELLGSGDTTAAALQLGKALNDPVANLGALSRAGIQFSKDQKDIIKSLVESNDIMSAQNIILNELERQFGGTAEAARDTFGGALKSSINALKDFGEKLGFVVTKSDAVIKFFKDLELSIRNLDLEEFNKYILPVLKFFNIFEFGANILDTSVNKTGEYVKVQKELEDSTVRAAAALRGMQDAQNNIFAKDTYDQFAKQYSDEMDNIRRLTKELNDLKNARLSAIPEDKYGDNSYLEKSLKDFKRTDKSVFSDIDKDLKEYFKDLDEFEKRTSDVFKKAKDAKDKYLYGDNYKDIWMKQADDRYEVQSRGIERIIEAEKEASSLMIDISKYTAEQMQDAFSDFFFDIITGKLQTLGDYVNSFLNAMAKSISQVLAQESIKGITNFDWSSLFSSSAGAGSSFTNYAGYGPRALGGPTYANQAYLVGEKGPELLFMGNNNGYVQPNNSLSGDVNINIENYTDANVQASSKNINGEREILIRIANDVNGGMIGKAIENRFGILPQTRGV